MFCTRCGAQLPQDAKFCENCGQPVKASPVPGPEPAAHEAPQTPAPPQIPLSPPPQAPPPPPAGPQFPPPPFEEPPQPVKKPFRPITVILPLLLLALAAGGFFAWKWVDNNNQFKAELADAKTAFDSGDYRQAEEYYQAALARKPNHAEAALGLARIWLCEDNPDEAQALLAGLALAEDDPLYPDWQRLLSAARLDPPSPSVRLDNFPVMTVRLDCGAPVELDRADVTLLENGVPCDSYKFTQENGVLTFTYQTQDAGYSAETREVEVSFQVEGREFTRSAAYDTPFFQPASVRLVSTDVSEYPVVKAYFRVEDAQTGDTIPGLDGNAFLIQERLEGGAYLQREVRAVATLEGNEGLNIDLVADKSSSIDSADMAKIKSVMIQFVNSLHFSVGDRAEVLAFDSIVQQMCAYTGDSALLINGINNMSADGRTAFYDAVYAGINHAALQGGARCVIAFTDGIDNESNYTASDVIRYANVNQVPVYIIGVGGSVEANVLRRVAEETGGRYWFIDDLYDLSVIFNSIYAEQKELYCVEYTSDETADEYAARDLDLQVTGGGYKGEEQFSFQPVHTINDNGGVNLHGGSRYVLFKESLTWEQATQRCQEMGGHLATITSQAEMDEIIRIAEAEDVKYLWLGGYTSYGEDGSVFGHWVTGEEFSFEAWGDGEPSRVDQDGTEEWYIMLWNIPSMGGWSWNDQRNNPAGPVPAMAKSMGFVCEFEN